MAEDASCKGDILYAGSSISRKEVIQIILLIFAILAIIFSQITFRTPNLPANWTNNSTAIGWSLVALGFLLIIAVIVMFFI